MSNRKLFISMYHYTRDLEHSRYPGIKGMNVDLFRRQMEFFKANCNVIRMEQVIEAIQSGESLPENAVLLTFDDGYLDNFTVAFPILEEFGVSGFFFHTRKNIYNPSASGCKQNSLHFGKCRY